MFDRAEDMRAISRLNVERVVSEACKEIMQAIKSRAEQGFNSYDWECDYDKFSYEATDKIGYMLAKAGYSWRHGGGIMEIYWGDGLDQKEIDEITSRVEENIKKDKQKNSVWKRIFQW